jgi:EAL domain-containing protein (putative c-di-GMP-specific phosphodiesterase class I)
VKSSTTRTLLPGTTIFKQGDDGDCAYLIESGEVQVTLNQDGEDIPIALLGPGDILGEMSVIDGLKRSATAICLSTVLLSSFTRQQLKQRIDAMDPLARLLLSVLVQRVRESNSRKISRTQGEDTALIRPVSAQDQLIRGDSEQALQRIKIELELQEALRSSEFLLNYQPIVDLRTGQTVGFEALLRWDSKKRGRVRTDLFIDIAEESSLIIPISAFVFERAFNDLNILKNSMKQKDLYMSVNVSARHFSDPNFVIDLENVRKKSGVQPSSIKLEITERVLMEGALAIDTINAVRALGYKVSLDDFGTGYSSFAYLAKMSLDTIKVDRSFVSDLGKKPRSQAVVTAIISLAKSLGLELVAEGIEQKEEQFILQGMGCTIGQGYLFGRPASLEVLIHDAQKKTAA